MRSVLATALNLGIGRWMWWPSKLAHTPDPPPAERGHDRAGALARI
jgi:putative drug exporter of the RND superfamily